MLRLIVIVTLVIAAGRVAVAQDAAEAVRKAEQGFFAAIRGNDRRALGRSLAARFFFIDGAGENRVKSRVMDNMALLAGRGENETNVTIKPYGPIVVVSGTGSGLRFSRFWVARRAGWLLYAVIETPATTRQEPTAASGMTGPCDNPCRSVPYRPLSFHGAAVIAAWKEVETAKWRKDAGALARGLGDEFVLIGPDGVASRSELLALLRSSSRPGIPGDPAQLIRIHDFDRVALMVSRHTPYRGGRPYHAVRLWIFIDGRWKLAVEQRTTVIAASSVPAVPTARR